MGNIFGASNHPVEIKKIQIKIWTLRSEVEEAITKKLSQKNDLDPNDIQSIVEEYSFKPGLQVIEGGANEESTEKTGGIQYDENGEPIAKENAVTPEEEDAIAKQMAASLMDDDDDTDEEGQEDEASLESNNEEENSEENVQENKNVVIQKIPKLSPEKYANGVCLLSDFAMGDICFFSTKPFLGGQNIVIEFILPERFTLFAEILTCKNFNMSSRIISSTRPPFRVHARFTFARAGERTLLRKFLKSIEPEKPKEAPKKAKQSNDDEFDDLDDLDI